MTTQSSGVKGLHLNKVVSVRGYEKKSVKRYLVWNEFPCYKSCEYCNKNGI